MDLGLPGGLGIGPGGLGIGPEARFSDLGFGVDFDLWLRLGVR